jgi:hypothetical protein
MLQHRANVSGRRLTIISLSQPRCRRVSGDKVANFTLEFRKNLHRLIGLCALTRS